MSEKFCLKWNDFNSNVSQSFGKLRNEDYLHDVTLVSDDHHQISAHKLVLSASSEYFKNIFKNSNKPNSHPLVCLNEINSNDLKIIMDYIYNGEVQVFQDNLDRFLSIAQRLKLEGLLGNNEAEPDPDDTTTADDTKFETGENMDTAREKIKDTLSNKSNEVEKVDKIIAPFTPLSSSDTSDIETAVQQYIVETDTEGKFKCTICGKEAVAKYSSVARSNLKKHIETHFEGLSFSCQLCGKIFRSRNALQIHNTRFHK